MIHTWLLIFFIRPVAYNHPYQNPVVEFGQFQTYASCAMAGRATLRQEPDFEEFGCVPQRTTELAEVPQ